MSEENTERRNYSEKEKLLLVNLIENYKIIIENKKTDGETIRRKQEVWETVCELYNTNKVTKRNVKQLKKLWDNIKQKTKRSDLNRQNYILINGEAPLEEDNSLISEKVRSIVSNINRETDNNYNDYESIIMCVDGNDNLNTNSNLQDEEASLRVKKLDEEIEHQKELHKGKMEVRAAKNECQDKSDILTSNSNLLEDEEAALRIKQLEEAIWQQRELHKAKMETASAEKKYWRTKTELLLRQKNGF